MLITVEKTNSQTDATRALNLTHLLISNAQQLQQDYGKLFVLTNDYRYLEKFNEVNQIIGELMTFDSQLKNLN